MEVLSSRVLLHPVDFERSFRFYAESLGLPIYREWEVAPTGAWCSSSVEASSSCLAPRVPGPARCRSLWLQVRDVDAVGHELEEAGVDIIGLPTDKPWGLREMRIRDPDGLRIVIVEVPEDHPLRRR